MIQLPQQLTPFDQKNTHLKTSLNINMVEIEPTSKNLNYKYLFIEN